MLPERFANDTAIRLWVSALDSLACSKEIEREGRTPSGSRPLQKLRKGTRRGMSAARRIKSRLTAGEIRRKRLERFARMVVSDLDDLVEAVDVGHAESADRGPQDEIRVQRP